MSSTNRSKARSARPRLEGLQDPRRRVSRRSPHYAAHVRQTDESGLRRPPRGCGLAVSPPERFQVRRLSVRGAVASTCKKGSPPCPRSSDKAQADPKDAGRRREKLTQVHACSFGIGCAVMRQRSRPITASRLPSNRLREHDLSSVAGSWRTPCPELTFRAS